MKKYIVMLGAACALSLSSCNYLDVKPESVITDNNYWKTPEHFESFMIGLHSRFRSHSYRFFILGETRSDVFGDSPFGGEATQGLEILPLNNLSVDNVGLSNYGGFYTNINQLNLMIAKTEETSLLTDDKKAYYLGQAYGMRAYYYYQIYRSWGAAVLQIEPTLGTNLDITNLAKEASPAEDVLAQVVKDIEASNAAFGTNYSFKSKNYWSKAATQMLRADVMLWKGHSENNVAYFADAQAAMEELQSKTSLSLVPEFVDVFAYNKKRNAEIIFALRSEANEFSLWDGAFADNFLPQNSYLANYYNAEGDKWNTIDDNMFGMMRMQVKRAHFETTFDSEDTRFEATLKGVFSKEENSDVLSYAGCFPNKFQGTTLSGSNKRSMIDDYPIYRYADAVLMLAEAKAMQGTDASKEINDIRSRAYGKNYDSSFAFPNQEGDADVKEAILKERLREFFFEGKRWYDLRRFGNEYVFKYTTANAANPGRLYWPIDRTTLTNNPKLEQTVGY
ncbi:MAG: SusD family outer membrane lipoprotein NanU [Marinifilaceae bacterium]